MPLSAGTRAASEMFGRHFDGVNQHVVGADPPEVERNADARFAALHEADERLDRFHRRRSRVHGDHHAERRAPAPQSVRSPSMRSSAIPPARRGRQMESAAPRTEPVRPGRDHRRSTVPGRRAAARPSRGDPGAPLPTIAAVRRLPRHSRARNGPPRPPPRPRRSRVRRSRADGRASTVAIDTAASRSRLPLCHHPNHSL